MAVVTLLDGIIVATILPIEAVTLGWAFRRSGFIPFPHGLMIYLFLGQIILTLNAFEVIQYYFARLYTTYAFIDHFQRVFFLLMGMFFVSAFAVPKSKVSIGTQLQSLNVSNEILFGVVAFLYVYDLAFYFFLDWDVAWRTATYLTMSSEAVLARDNILSRALLSGFSIVGLVVFSTMAFAFASGKRLIAALMLPLAAWHFLFVLAAHSRLAAGYLYLIAALILLLRRWRVATVTIIVIGFLTQMSVLWGRDYGPHGFSSIPSYWTNIVNYVTIRQFEAFNNFFEGIFVTSEYFNRTFDYPTIYRVLTFSPLLSIVDNFSSVRDAYEIRLHDYVPNSAVSEVLSFGFGYAMIFFGVELAAGYASAKLMAERPGPLPLFLNATVFLTAYQQFAYPARPAFRVFLFALVITIFVQRRENKKQRLVLSEHRGPDTDVAPAQVG